MQVLFDVNVTCKEQIMYKLDDGAAGWNLRALLVWERVGDIDVFS